MINLTIGEWENAERPASAASSFSSPIGLGLDADGIRSSSRSAKSEGHGSRRKKEHQKHGKKHAFTEVGIRSIGDQIHSSYKGKCLQFRMFSNTGAQSFTGFSYEYNNISLYIGNQGFLNMLKQKFLKSSNRGTDYDAGGSLHRPGKLRCRNVRCMDNFKDENNTKNLLVTNLGNLNATNATNSANVTPEMTRREYAPEMRNESGVR